MDYVFDYDKLEFLSDDEISEFLELHSYEVSKNRSINLNSAKKLLKHVLKSGSQITPTILSLWISDQLNIEETETYTKDKILNMNSKNAEQFRRIFNLALNFDHIQNDEYLKETILEILRFSGKIIDIPQKLYEKEADLLSSQKKHYANITEIINRRWHAYQDTTPMGGGKTFVTSKLMQDVKKANPQLEVIIIAPKAVHTKWRRVPRKFGIEILDVLSYETLSGKKGHELTHPYLTRTTIDKTTNYSVTPEFDKLVKNGLLLIFDENQYAKNSSSLRSMACFALTSHIIDYNKQGKGNSRVVLLSASPGNNEKHTYSMLRMLGIARSEDVMNKHRVTGLKEVYNFCLALNENLTKRVCPFFPTSKEESLGFVHALYYQIIKPYVSSAAPMPEIPPGRDFKNGYYKITNKGDIKNIQKGIGVLNNIREMREQLKLDIQNKKKIKETGKNHLEGISKEEIQKREDSFIAQMTNAMMAIEYGKINDLYRVTKKILDEKPSAKVIIGVNYKESIERLKRLFASYEPLILTGDMTSQSKRDKIVDDFQEGSARKRLLIMITTVGSVGLDLDDKFGNFQRHMFIIPDFHFLAKYQATGRIARADTKSKPILRFFYGKGEFVEETKLLSSTIKKTEIAKDLLALDIPTPFPGDFENEVEED